MEGRGEGERRGEGEGEEEAERSMGGFVDSVQGQKRTTAREFRSWEDGRWGGKRGIDSDGETVASDNPARGAWLSGSELLIVVVRIARSRGR